MRQIKFRGISLQDNEFVYGGFYQPHDPNFDDPNEEVFIVITEELGDVLGSEQIEVKPDTIGQFTGLTDKNGKEIYEGDIVKIQDPYNGDWSTNGAEVIFSNEYVGGWVISDSSERNLILGTRQNRLEIIGNIHQHAHLLNN